MRTHSVVDLITNSSTSIYSTATDESLKAFKMFVNGILKTTGNSQTADELYNFELRISRASTENAMYSLTEIEFPGDVNLVAFLSPEELQAVQTFKDANWDDPDRAAKENAAHCVCRRVLEEKPEMLSMKDENGDPKRFTYDVEITDKQGNSVTQNIVGTVDSWEEHE